MMASLGKLKRSEKSTHRKTHKTGNRDFGKCPQTRVFILLLSYGAWPFFVSARHIHMYRQLLQCAEYVIPKLKMPFCSLCRRQCHYEFITVFLKSCTVFCVKPKEVDRIKLISLRQISVSIALKYIINNSVLK